jgi:hypothetical protein
VELNDKNTLSFVFEEAGNKDKPANPFDILNSEEVVETSSGLTVNLFQPNAPDKADFTEERKVDMVTNDVNSIKSILVHFLKGWMTSEQVKGRIMPFTGVPIDATNYNQQILKPDILAAIQKNMATTFIQIITPLLSEAKPFRLLLIRQSTDKHWPTFRKRYIEENPFWESMEIPKEASKLKFTADEKGKKLNDPTVTVKKDAVDKPIDQAPVTAANVFGS